MHLMDSKKPGRPPKKGPRAPKRPQRRLVCLPDAILFDAWIRYKRAKEAAEEPEPNASAILASALKKFLRGEGFWPPPPRED